MNLDFIKRALCFHGQPMQKIWENERGATDLQELGIPLQPNYDIYQARQRYFTFQDRAKRLKLHQFFARKANDLYDSELKKYTNLIDEKHLEKAKPFFATLPPYELFAQKSDQRARCKAILEGVNPGDVMYASVVKTTPSALTVKALCTAEPIIRYFNHLPVKALVLAHDVGSLPLESDGSVRGYHVSDFICCEIVRVLVDVKRIFLAMTGVPKDQKTKFGLISQDDLPLYYKKAITAETQSYEECFEKSREILNPNYDVLFSINGLDVNDNFTLMGALKRPFPEDEFAKNIRKSQASKWAFRAVADGIERFKRGLHVEAFQALNKALAIDPCNVEGLVARGALFANRGSFQKAVDDFKTALEINEYHGNARKYLGETLVALGRSLEDDKRYDEAGKAYMDCLGIIPQHPQALECLEKLNQVTGRRIGMGILDTDILEHLINLPGPSTSSGSNGSQMLKKKMIPDKSSSEDSSSDSDDSNSDSETNNTKKLKAISMLSPLSQRMALHSASLQAAAASKPMNPSTVQYDQPFYFYLEHPTASAVNSGNDFKLEDDDTATRVRKLLEEASQHRKAQKKKKMKNKKHKKTGEKEKNSMEELSGTLFQNNYLKEALKTVGSDNMKEKLEQDISSYERKIADIKNQQAELRNSLAGPLLSSKHHLSTKDDVINIDDSPPPPPPPFIQISRTGSMDFINTESSSSKNFPMGLSKQKSYDSKPTTSLHSTDSKKLSFQIKKPVKTDFFGMVRIASPINQKSPSLSRSPHSHERRRSRYRSRSRDMFQKKKSVKTDFFGMVRIASPTNQKSPSHSRSPHSHERRRSRYRSRSRDRRSRSRGCKSYRRYSRARYSRSRSRSRSGSRRRYRSRSHSRSHSRKKSYSRRRSRSLSQSSQRHQRSHRRSSSYSKSQSPARTSGKRDFRRGTGLPHETGSARWKHDKYEMFNTLPNARPPKDDDGPTIEEIDEIINQAQKERKAEIIKRDKDILKKVI